MSNTLTPVNSQVLDRFTKKDTERVERKAISLYEQTQKTSVQFAAELHRLQEGAAHLTRGYSNFGEYAEHTFEGVSAVNAFAISRQGRVLVLLEANGRISLEGKGTNLPGTTGVRALAKVLKDLGEEAMLAIYDEAAKSDRKVIEDTVLAACQKLIAPKVAELGESSLEPEEEDEDEDEDEPEAKLPEKVQELIDHIRDLTFELPDSVTELLESTERLKGELGDEDATKDEAWVNSKR